MVTSPRPLLIRKRDVTGFASDLCQVTTRDVSRDLLMTIKRGAKEWFDKIQPKALMGLFGLPGRLWT
jgi:hypothetical protein